MKKNVVVLGLAQLTIPQKIELSRSIVTSMTGNPNFTTPSPALATITTNVNALETAHIAAATGGPDETAAMHAKELLLEFSLKSLAAYVEGIANANLVNAEAIILGAGMKPKKTPLPKENGFRASLTGKPGEALLRTDYVPRCTFRWEMTTTPFVLESWKEIHSGTQAKFVVTGLTAGTIYYFRVAVIDRNGQQPWSTVRYLMAVGLPA